MKRPATLLLMDKPSADADIWNARLALAVIVASLAARIYLYAFAPSLWDDEIFLCLAIITHPISDLVRKLDFEQFAPLGFVWLQRIAVDIAGVSERSLRLVPFLAGCLSVIAAWDASRRLFNSRAAILTAALIGFSPYALRYSNEAKQYGLEVFVSAALLWIVSLSPDPPARFLSAAGLIAAGVIAMFVSTPAIFVLGGIWLFYAAYAGRDKPKKIFIFPVASGAIWAGVFALVYRFLLMRQVDSYLYLFWEPLRFSKQSGALNLLNLVTHGFLDPLLSLDSVIPALLYLAGCVCLLVGTYVTARERSQLALLLTIPLVLVLSAGAIDKWYFSARLMMFTLPFCALLITAGVCWIAGLGRPQWSRPLFIGASVLLMAFPIRAVTYSLRHPQIENLRAAVDFCRARLQPGDTIYVFARSMPGWIYYSMDWVKPDLARYRWLKAATEATGPNGGNVPPGEHPVLDEGEKLIHPYGEGFELAGIAEGGFRTISSSPNDPAAPGWAAKEARRILKTRMRRVVILASSVHERNLKELVDCLKSSGARSSARFQQEAGRAEIMDLPLARDMNKTEPALRVSCD
jgi:hypothetical protein